MQLQAQYFRRRCAFSSSSESLKDFVIRHFVLLVIMFSCAELARGHVTCQVRGGLNDIRVEPHMYVFSCRAFGKWTDVLFLSLIHI